MYGTNDSKTSCFTVMILNDSKSFNIILVTNRTPVGYEGNDIKPQNDELKMFSCCSSIILPWVSHTLLNLYPRCSQGVAKV